MQWQRGVGVGDALTLKLIGLLGRKGQMGECGREYLAHGHVSIREELDGLFYFALKDQVRKRDSHHLKRCAEA